MLFFFSPLTDPDDGEVLDGQAGPGHDPSGTEENIQSAQDIDSFVCGIQVEDELDAAIENAHKNDDCDSSSGFVDEDPCQDGMNEDSFETDEVVGTSPTSQDEDALMFDDTGEDLQQEDLDLDSARPEEPDQEAFDEKEKEEEMAGRKWWRWYMHWFACRWMGQCWL